MRKQSLFDTRTFPLNPWAALGLMLLLACIGSAHSAGLGRLNVQSQMGQPFVADIELVNVGKDELSTLQASLAPTAAYEAANLRFDPALNTLRVAVAQRPNGAPYLRVSTWRPVVEPYLDLVIDLNWPGGKFRRAYSALLEPPVLADPPRAPAAAAPAPMVETAPPVQRPAAPPVTRPAASAPAVPATGATATAPPRVASAPAPSAAPQPAAKAVEAEVKPPGAKPEAAKAKPEPESKPVEPAKAETPAAQPAAPAENPAAPAPEASPPAAAPKTAAPPAPAPVQRTWMDSLNDYLIPIGAGLLALLAALGVFLIARRRQQREAPASVPVAPVLRQAPRQPAAAMPATSSATTSAVTPVAAPAAAAIVDTPTVANVTDSVDPLDEAQVYLDHGQDEQAETILREALAKQPGREDVHLKLLEILAARGDKIAFNRLAGGLHKLTYGRGELWQRAAALGYALDPANPLYPPTNKAVELPAQHDSTAALDVDRDRTPAPDAMSNTTSILLDRADDKPIDMEKTMVLTREALQPAKPEAAPAQPPLDFNFELPAAGSAPATAPAAAAAAPTSPKADNLIDFKVELPDINLNLDDKPVPRVSRSVRDEAWEEVQQKLDLARAYQEMGDKEGALETLSEIGNGGDEAQKAEAHNMLEELRAAKP